MFEFDFANEYIDNLGKELEKFIETEDMEGAKEAVNRQMGYAFDDLTSYYYTMEQVRNMSPLSILCLFSYYTCAVEDYDDEMYEQHDEIIDSLDNYIETVALDLTKKITGYSTVEDVELAEKELRESRIWGF